MARGSRDLFVVTEGRWMHFRVIRVHHRHFPEARGEGRSLREAARHLARQLTRSIDRAHGPRRKALERAVAGALALGSTGRRPSGAPVAVTSRPAALTIHSLS